jgi:cell division protein FtsN
MPRDYKGSAYRVGKPLKKPGIDSWDRILIVGFIILLALLVKHFIIAEQNKITPAMSVTSTAEQITHDKKIATATNAAAAVAKEAIAAGGLSQEELNFEPNADLKVAAEQKVKATVAANTPPRQDSIPVEPHFDFYTILPSVEVVIPDHEIKTRIREEKIGKTNDSAKYIMQAGSFRDSPEAEQLRAKLTTMGIESRVEKAQVGEAMWYRVKVGPYSGMTSVMAIKTRLRDSGIDAIVLEFK